MTDYERDILRYMREHSANLRFNAKGGNFILAFPSTKKRPKPRFAVPLEPMTIRHLIGMGYVENVSATSVTCLALTDKGVAHARTYPLKPIQRRGK